MFNIAKKKGWETFWDSVKFTRYSTFVDALGPRDAIEIKPKSNTAIYDYLARYEMWCSEIYDRDLTLVGVFICRSRRGTVAPDPPKNYKKYRVS